MINQIFKAQGSRFFLAVVVVLTACSKEKFSYVNPAADTQGNSSGWNMGGGPGGPLGWWSGFTMGIFSTRPQMQDKSVVLIQFHNPPLLSTVQTGPDGIRSVDQDLKAAIDKEQTIALASMKALSGEIVILYRYRMVLNAVAAIVPNSLLDKLNFVGGVAYVESDGTFARPEILATSETPENVDLTQANSVKFIGAEKVHRMKVKDHNGNIVPLDGTGMRVGIIDTGIDYTHAMLGGAGTDAAYKAIDPSKATTAFPTAKVIGGVDLVGTDYDSASGNLADRVPMADANPIDEFGHGSHVAGTVAGHGDGVNTYDGVAPGAQLYAIKVFGASGSTGDAVVIAGLEYAADPTGQADPNQELDAVNLSLGGAYGSPHSLYQQAIGNLTTAGTAVLTAAGNSGPLDYIVGDPSAADDAFSIAASIDNASQNWQFPTVKFAFTGGTLVSQAMFAPIGLSADASGGVSGNVLYAGLADKDFTADVKAKLKGQVALMDRGDVAFEDKIRRAVDAGVIGVIIANNQAGDPIGMGGTGSYPVPAVMILQSAGDAIKEKLGTGAVSVTFNAAEKVKKPELIDTITDFSSKGPRSFDSAIKPEVAAPGQNIISILMGSGNKGVQMSGTSMATPHMTGVMTLLKQQHPELTIAELKSLVMGTAKQLSDTKGQLYPVSLQGAGRVQVDKAVLSPAVTLPAALSLGEQNLAGRKTVGVTITVKNISSGMLTFTPSFKPRVKGIQMNGANSLTLAAGSSGAMQLSFALDATLVNDPVQELDGFVTLKTGGAVDLTLPVLAVVKKISSIKAGSLVTQSTSDDAAGASVELKVKNSGLNSGDVMAFNLLGVDTRKPNPTDSPYLDTSCNLQAAGYRIIHKTVNGQSKVVLQIAAKLYTPETTWNMCEISVLIDKDGKGTASEELSGIALNTVPGLGSDGTVFASVLFDAAKVRDLRRQYEIAAQDKSSKATENYQPGVIDENAMMVINHSTVAVIEAPVDELTTANDGQLSVRVATISDKVSVQTDDFLEKSASQWTRISLQENTQSYVGMPEKTTLVPGQEMTLRLTKGFGTKPLLLLSPQNANVFSDQVIDGQGQILKTTYQP